MKRLVALTALVMGAALASQASAGIALTAGSGWQYDQVDAANANSEGSPITFTLTGPGVFSLVDGFNPGDIYKIYDDTSHLLVGTTTFYAGGAADVEATGPDVFSFNESWKDGSFSKIAMLLGSGSYSLDIQGNGAGGFPAGFGVRLDGAVPEPATWAMLILGVAMLGFAARRRNAGAPVAA